MPQVPAISLPTAGAFGYTATTDPTQDSATHALAGGGSSASKVVTTDDETGAFPSSQPLGTNVHMSGTFAALPAAGVSGRYYDTTDTFVRYRDNGVSWVAVGAGLNGSGLVPTAELGTGTGTNAKVLQGDSTWVAKAGVDTTALHSGDAAGGGLGGTYPNPTVTPAAGLDTTAVHTSDYPITVAHGGTSQITALAARSSSGLNIDQRTTFSNAAYVAVATDRYIGQVGTLTASRIVTLPSAAAVNAGQKIIVADESGTCGTNQIQIFPAGGQTIDLGASWILASPNHAAELISDGVSNWTVDNGHLSAYRNLADVLSASTSRVNLGLAIGTNVEAWDATLDAFAAYNTNGLLTQTAADTFTGRTLTGTANRVTVTNGSGVAGNPTLDVGTNVLVSGDITIDRQEFTGSGTWTKPSNALLVIGHIVGAGSGAGAGRRGAAGSLRGGGAGGSAGGVADFVFRASDLNATETVTIGTGGAGGAAQTVDSTDGAGGAVGGDSTFGTGKGKATGGGLTGFGLSGGGTSTAGGAAGGGGSGTRFNSLFGTTLLAGGGPAGSDGSANAASGVTGVNGGVPGSGGAGGGLPTGNTNRPGGTGGADNGGTAGGTFGTSGGGSGGNGAAPSAGDHITGQGGGGGGSNNAGVGGSGGNGAARGGGGGGGGSSVNGSNSGKGGNGGDGYCIVYTFCERGGTT